MLSHISKFIKQNAIKLAFAIIFLIIVDLAQLISPWLIGTIIDELTKADFNKDDFSMYLLIFALIEVCIFLFRFAMRKAMNEAAYDIEYKIRNKYFEHLLYLDQNFYNKNKTGDLMARATNDIKSITMMFSDGIIMFVDSLLLISVIFTVCITSIDLKLTLMSTATLPIIVILTLLASPSFIERIKILNENFGKLSEKARESFSNAKLIKAFSKENYMSRLFYSESLKLSKSRIKFMRLASFLFPMVTFLSMLSLIIAINVGGNLVIEKNITIGQFVSFMNYLQKIIWPFMAIGFLITLLQTGIASLSRINEIFNSKSIISDSDYILKKQIMQSQNESEKISSIDNNNNNNNSNIINNINGKIEIRNLSYSYQNSVIPTLKHLSFEIKNSQSLGIIGKTASGKSTLLKLMMRIYETDDDTIFYDGISIKNIPLEKLKTSIAFAHQESFIFSKSVKDNIAIKGEGNTDIKKIKHCAKISCIHDEIMMMKNGYDTILGEKGVNLSGGQKQRLSLARTLMHGGSILLLDDILSASDNITQDKILYNLKNEVSDKTKIIVSHRISTIKDCDLILVLDDGFISQMGKHSDLLKEDGFYQKLYNLQNCGE